MNQVRALVWKDLRIHWRFVVTYLVVWPIVMRVVFQAQHSMGFTRGQPLASMVIPTAISLSMIFAIFLAHALIERERGKSTFASIRTLPASDLHIVFAKFATVLAFGLLAGVGWWVAMQGIELGLTPWQGISVWLVWEAFAGVALFFQVLFSGRLAGLTPGVLFFIASGIAFLVGRSPEAVVEVRQMWNDPGAHAWLWLTCVAVESGAMAATYARFHRQDSHRLAE